MLPTCSHGPPAIGLLTLCEPAHKEQTAESRAQPCSLSCCCSTTSDCGKQTELCASQRCYLTGAIHASDSTQLLFKQARASHELSDSPLQALLVGAELQPADQEHGVPLSGPFGVSNGRPTASKQQTDNEGIETRANVPDSVHLAGCNSNSRVEAEVAGEALQLLGLVHTRQPYGVRCCPHNSATAAGAWLGALRQRHTAAEERLAGHHLSCHRTRAALR